MADPRTTLPAHEHYAEHVGELMEHCICGATRLNDTWRIPDDARTWGEPPTEPGNTQAEQGKEKDASEPSHS